MDEDDDDTRVSLAKQGLPANGAGPGGAAGPGEAGAGEAPGSPVPPAGEDSLDAVVSGAAYAVLGLFGAVYGLIGSFVQDWTVERVPVASIVLVLVLFAAVRLAGWGTGGRTGPVIIALTWLIVVFVLSNEGPGGDLVMPTELSGKTNYAGYVYIIGGLAAAVLAILRVRPAGPSGQWLLGRGGRTDR
ncbi:hypothetical protein E1264_29580 [Actinomadura sp. KC216]|uniref:DUF6113 family protein n=1 Tax=Actinomadura sp. KC216 TaxID=2530370 RepID=UPI001052F847|nr:DUF6113 family protein [Actinomadura sp. KC216]TDB83139.1 hypothetical protein E1264_29580 [Actinomadura sp. KC216]